MRPHLAFQFVDGIAAAARRWQWKQGLQQQQLFRFGFQFFAWREGEFASVFHKTQLEKRCFFLRVVLAFRVGPKFLLRIVGNKKS